MSKIKGEDVKEFVWGVCELLASQDGDDLEPGHDYDKDELQDRYSIAFLTNPSLYLCLHNLISIQQVVDFIDATIEAFGYIPCGNVRYIEALLMNPSLFKMLGGLTTGARTKW